MRIILEVTHPAHVHFFRHPIDLLKGKGHDILITSRGKDCTLSLLDEINIPHQKISTAGTGGIFSMFHELARRDVVLFKTLRKFRADVIAGVGGTSAAHVGVLARCPSIIFYDTEEATLQNAITYPLASRIVVPESYRGWSPRRRTIRYRGYHELSYLHPGYFKPDRSIALHNGLAQEGDTFLIRLVSWNANHDLGLTGWDTPTLRRVVDALSARGKVLISSEAKLPNEFSALRYSGRQSAIHHVISFCRMVVGESATMASEAVVLGVPAIYAAPSYRGYISEQETCYGMSAFVSDPTAEAISGKINQLLALSNEELSRGHAQLLDDCVDVPKFIANTIVEVAL